jgi:hypothetical protein
MKRFSLTILICFVFIQVMQAQLLADAGWDKAYCGFNTLSLGGSPTAQGGIAPYTYLWKLANGSPATNYLSNDTSANPFFLNGINSSSKYIDFIVTVTDAANASASDTVKVSFSTWSCVLQDCIHYKSPGDTVTLFPRCSSNFSPMDFQWFPPIGLSNTHIANPRCTTPVNTRYHVFITDSVGCTLLDSCDVYVWPTSVTASKHELETTFPNPLTSASRLMIPTRWKGGTLSVFTVDGKLISRTLLEKTEIFPEPLVGRHTGIFYYHISVGGERVSSGKWERR